MSGGKVVAIPGEIKGYHEAWRRFGRLPWKELFEPTIKMCRDGYKIGPSMGKHIKTFAEKYDGIRYHDRLYYLKVYDE